MGIHVRLAQDTNADTVRLDPALPLAQLTQFAETLESSRHRAMVETFRSHVYNEMVTLDVDALMATLVPDPIFRFHGLPGVGDLVGYDEVRAYYEKSRASRAAGLTIVL